MIQSNTNVKLISSTRGVNNESLKDLVVYCARVSNPKSQIEGLNNDGLLRYLERNNHWSPFEMVHICMEIETTRDIARQVLRHRSFSFQEFSQRYAEVTKPMVLREPRLQDQKNRQNSLALDDQIAYNKAIALMKRAKDATLSSYTDLLALGVAKEQARCVLPEGMTPSTMYMAGSLRSWIHYTQVRGGHGTQKEHVEVADGADIILKELLR